MSLITQKETENLIMSVLAGCGKTGATEETLQRVCEWANGVRIDSELLQGLIEGKIILDPTETDVDKWRFKAL